MKICFIFDNCDDYQSIKDYLVMISFLKGAKEIYLEPFNEKECIKFIMKCFGVKEEESKEILKLLEPSDELKRPNDLIKLKAYVELNRNEFQKISIKFINDLKSQGKYEEALDMYNKSLKI